MAEPPTRIIRVPLSLVSRAPNQLSRSSGVGAEAKSSSRVRTSILIASPHAKAGKKLVFLGATQICCAVGPLKEEPTKVVIDKEPAVSPLLHEPTKGPEDARHLDWFGLDHSGQPICGLGPRDHGELLKQPGTGLAAEEGVHAPSRQCAVIYVLYTPRVEIHSVILGSGPLGTLTKGALDLDRKNRARQVPNVRGGQWERTSVHTMEGVSNPGDGT